MIAPGEMVLIVCDGNSARSQMAEGWLRQMAKGRFKVASAGAHPREAVHPLAVTVMREVGIDISSGYPKPLHIFRHDRVKVLITVCASAKEACVTFPGASMQIHWPMEDPTAATGEREAQLVIFRTIRDELRQRLTDWLQEQGLSV
jgi:arsenate reductase